MGFCFLLTALMVIPDAAVVIKGLVPRIPDTANAGLIVAGMIGTTMGGVLYAALGLVVPIFGGRPVLVMIVTQIFALFITPLILILMTVLQNRKDIMGSRLASQGTNIMLAGIILCTVFIALVGIIGIIEII